MPSQTQAARVEEEVKADLVRARIALKGGIGSKNPPDLTAIKPRVGQNLEVFDNVLDFDDLETLPTRPAESSLPRLTSKDLLPPPSSKVQPLDYFADPDLHEYVQEQNIEFVVMQRQEGDPQAPWSCPSKAVLERIFNHVRVKQDHIQILDTAQWCRYDTDNEVASIMLSTVNYHLMQAIRHEIRIYEGEPGFRYETYNKAQFIQKYGITCYLSLIHI